ncbi:Myosin regulatory light chain 12B [Grifola frondosa]|uniref:Myosin regulatory light chain 12B n=1 Tax=Grifola frondosa TaxID=5627 RepID=A0A1C7MP74_GRIFR|nr:Myosin regulatory light chain 12B [Grifola frondosa]
MARYPSHLSPDITPTSTPNKLTKAQKSRQRREPSGVFSLFSPAQIQQFREAFSLIDHDGDGIASEQDLKHIYSSLGLTPSRTTMEALLADRPGDRRSGGAHSRCPVGRAGDHGITFPMFLTMMGEHLYDFDTEAELLQAFECFDEGDTGLVKCDEIKKWLGEAGERMDEQEINKFLKGPFTHHGNFNYREWIKVLRINADNEPDSQ